MSSLPTRGTSASRSSTTGARSSRHGARLASGLLHSPATPWAFAVDGSGNVFVADTFFNLIQKFDNDGTFLATWTISLDSFDLLRGPIGVAVDASGHVFVAAAFLNNVQKFVCP